MRLVQLDQEIAPAHVTAVVKAAKDALRDIALKDVGRGRLAALEDDEGRRWIRIMVEVG